jgi:diguanylate cyclase (GGDEF)-like protein
VKDFNDPVAPQFRAGDNRQKIGIADFQHKIPTDGSDFSPGGRDNPITHQQRPKTARLRVISSLILTVILLVGLLGTGINLGWYFSQQNKLLAQGTSTARYTIVKWQREVLKLQRLLATDNWTADQIELQLDLVDSRAQIVNKNYLSQKDLLQGFMDAPSFQRLENLYRDWTALSPKLRGDVIEVADPGEISQINADSLTELDLLELELNDIIRQQEVAWMDAYTQLLNAQTTVIRFLWFGLLMFLVLVGLTILYGVKFQQERHHLLNELHHVNTQLSQANLQLIDLATLDELTQIANRRYFNVMMEQEWARAERGQYPMALILIDIDHFKAYNDRYGHQAGDGCLRAVAQALKQDVKRSGDLVARFGGEEFVILLPQTDVSGAIHVAKTIQQELATLKLPHEASPTSAYVTLCLGIAVLIPTPNNSIDQLIHEADKALYRAKQQGRNRYQIAAISTLPESHEG